MRELLESYLESPTDNNCRWFHFRQWLVPKGTDILMKGSPKSCKNFSMSENPSKSNKLWFLIRPPYINDNCKKLTTCNKNSNLLFCIQIIPTFILSSGSHACFPQSSLHSLLQKHDMFWAWSIGLFWQGQRSNLCLTKRVTWHITTIYGDTESKVLG